MTRDEPQTHDDDRRSLSVYGAADTPRGGWRAERRIAGIRHRITIWDLAQWSAIPPEHRPASADQIGSVWVAIEPI